MTPGKGIAVRFGVNKGNADAVKSPQLPPVTSTGGAGAGPVKSSFFKKAQGGNSSSMNTSDGVEQKSTPEIKEVDEGQGEVMDNFGMTDKNE
jgi:hypothetical protein